MDLQRIVVDDLQTTIWTDKWPYDKGCHLFHLDNVVSDLDVVAFTLGLKPGWRHDAPGFPHYDLTPAKRAKAVELGIRELHRRDPEFKAYLIRRRDAVRVNVTKPSSP